MHMNPVLYKDFTYFGDILYEISKRNILEKVKITKKFIINICKN